MKIALVAIALVAAVGLLSLAIGSLQWRRASEQIVTRLDAASVPPGRVFVEADLNGLPEPVARYFRRVLQSGQPLIRSVRLKQSGQFRMGEDEESWRPFQASQYDSAVPAAYLWDARIRFAPLLHVRVRDAYERGTGSMRAAFGGLVPVMNAHGASELNAGALQRFLAEAAWFPTVLLPGGPVTWAPIDASTARATITDGGTTVSLEFRFTSQGEIAGTFAPARFREVKGRYVPTPWIGRFWNYQERGGIRIPLDGEVAWQTGGVSVPYWRGTIVEIQYRFDGV